MPAKDEEDAIAGVISEVRSLLPEVAVLVVNDGSTDQTSTLARTAGAQVLDLPYNLGVGGAMRLGFRYAFANGHPVICLLYTSLAKNSRPIVFPPNAQAIKVFRA